ncbi:MAG: transglutaminase domain-containing protein, partial [Gammaproteobacteria bacterium]|nr:transglutaminase domain-containing protein [Gammaproteobacteria bacterium]
LLVRSKEDITQVSRYDLQAYVDYVAEPQLTASNRRQNLALPKKLNPRTHDLIAGWRQRYQDPNDVVDAALQHFRQQSFFYTLNPPKLTSKNTVDEFLFNSRRGFCEHYASAFTVMMRMAGIPARIVNGYQGGEFNPLTSHLTVRQADAHAWAEVWLSGQGWRRVDPTAAIAPARIELGLSEALPEGERIPSLVLADNAISRTFRFSWDALNNSWNGFVLGYRQELQMKLLARLGFKAPTLTTLVWVLAATLAVVIAFVAWSTRRRRKPKGKIDPVIADYEKLCKMLARAGLERRIDEGPLTFSQRAAAAFPQHGSTLKKIFSEYARLRFYPKINENTKRGWLQINRTFRRKTRLEPIEV